MCGRCRKCGINRKDILAHVSIHSERESLYVYCVCMHIVYKYIHNTQYIYRVTYIYICTDYIHPCMEPLSNLEPLGLGASARRSV